MTFDYCAAKEGKAFCGTREEILQQTGTYWFDQEGRLHWRVNRYPEQTLHSYSDEWTAEERQRDAVKTMFSKLGEYGFTTYKREVES